jgi:DNA-binding XRE family transcriptional regulator
MPRQTTSPADYPQAVLQQIEQLAQNIVIARKRRGESQAQWAKKLGISQPTMARIERGDPSVAMASYVMCMWLINQARGLADLIAPQHDHAALEKEVAKVRTKKKPAVLPAKAAQAPAISTEHALAVVQRMPSVQVDNVMKNLPALQLGQAIARMPAVQLGRALPPGVKAVMDFQNTPHGQSIQAGIKAAEGIAALLAKSDPKKK